MLVLSMLLAWAPTGLLAGPRPKPVGTAEPTSVILISVDTLRADHLSCYGYKKLQTPHIDSLARDGTLFT